MADPSRRVPAPALWLGVLGLVPFVGATGLSLMKAVIDPSIALTALITYGAVILSFLGGIHWGAALIRDHAKDAPGQTGWYVLSVLPSLVAWGALLMTPAKGLVTLAVSFLAMASIDTFAARAGQLPNWYPKLRWLLSTVVIVCLVVVGLS